MLPVFLSGFLTGPLPCSTLLLHVFFVGCYDGGQGYGRTVHTHGSAKRTCTHARVLIRYAAPPTSGRAFPSFTHSNTEASSTRRRSARVPPSSGEDCLFHFLFFQIGCCLGEIKAIIFNLCRKTFNVEPVIFDSLTGSILYSV